MSDVSSAIARAVAELRGPRREALDRAVAQDVLLAPGHRAWAVETALGRFTDDALEALAAPRYEGARVRVVLAATVPLAPLRALALPLLGGAVSVTARPSRRQGAVAAVVVEALQGHGLPVRLSHTRWHEGEAVVIAYGSDEGLDAVAKGLPPEVRFEGHGHGFGAALVDVRGASVAEAAQALALDVAAYEQRGCLSPQVVLAVGGGAEGLARALHEALAAREAAWPRAPLDAGTGAAVAQWQGVQAALADGALRARRHCVTWWERARMQSSPGARNVAVVAVNDLAVARELLAPWAPMLSSVGLAGVEGDAWVPAGFEGRVSAAGAMQDPALDGAEDPRPVRRR